MNIFVLDLDIEKCAQYHADQHVIKMILESAQMLCTVLHQNGISAPYRPTHFQHPCTVWAGLSLRNWLWLRTLALELNKEYRYRYERKRDHQSAVVVKSLSPPPIADQGLTEFAQVMPDRYQVAGNAVQAYRDFYIGEKASFAKWTKRSSPWWFSESASPT